MSKIIGNRKYFGDAFDDRKFVRTGISETNYKFIPRTGFMWESPCQIGLKIQNGGDE